jgi:threonylcarbamoyladenosine tRNA methylthiotransferase MtaB
MNSKTVSFYTLGCKLNFSETSTISRDLEEDGYAKIDFELGADIYVINTCSVTDQADKKCRNIVRRALKYNSNAFIVVIGCYAQLKPEEISRIEGVDLVLGAQEKFNISNYLKDTEKKKKPVLLNQPIKNVKTFYPGYSVGDRTRSFFKVKMVVIIFVRFAPFHWQEGKAEAVQFLKL